MADSIQSILVDDFIEIIIRPRDVTYYKTLGYDIPFENKKRSFFKTLVKIIDLPKYSTCKVKVRCTKCSKVREVSYRCYTLSSGICKECSCKLIQPIMTAANTGENNKNWKGGTTHLHDFIRNSVEHKLWRLSVYERDLFTCQKCGIKGTELNCHHIKSFVDIIMNNSVDKNNYMEFKETLFDTKNGITLCRECHLEYHKLNGGMKKEENLYPFNLWINNKEDER